MPIHSSTPTASALQPPDHPAPLFVPRRSCGAPAETWVTHGASVPDAWEALAEAKGFRINRRVRDRYHVVLECLACGAHTAQKVFTLRTAQPRCGGCAAESLDGLARQAGLVLLRRDPGDRHYGLFRASCGHVLRRQFELIHRITADVTGLRCETCHASREAKEAQAQDWTLVGPDPDGDRNYRHYRHACGHTQRVARVNMRTGRLDCAGCGESWASKPSWIYLVRLAFPETGLRVIKLGYSANPDLRFRQQLGLSPDTEIAALRLIPMPTGQAACAAERAMHAGLVRDFPDAVIPPDAYAGQINVTSEIYCPTLLPVLHRMLDRLDGGSDVLP